MTNQPGLEVSFTVTFSSEPVDLTRLERLLQFASEKQSAAGELGIWLCTDDEIADLHLRYLSIEGSTDVITFPGDGTLQDGTHLGDIAVSVETAAWQAGNAGHCTGREIAYLCLHGFLHLIGYDDLDESGRREMFARQEELLSEFEHAERGEWGRESGCEPDSHRPQRSRADR